MGIAIEAHALEHTQTKSRLNQNEEVKKIEKLLIQQVIKKITAYSQP
jgi:hypothetical protein